MAPALGKQMKGPDSECDPRLEQGKMREAGKMESPVTQKHGRSSYWTESSTQGFQTRSLGKVKVQKWEWLSRVRGRRNWTFLKCLPGDRC